MDIALKTQFHCVLADFFSFNQYDDHGLRKYLILILAAEVEAWESDRPEFESQPCHRLAGQET